MHIKNDRYGIDLAALEANELDPFIRDVIRHIRNSNYHNKKDDTVYQFISASFTKVRPTAKVSWIHLQILRLVPQSGSDSKPAKSTIVVDWSQIDASQSISIITNVDADGKATRKLHN